MTAIMGPMGANQQTSSPQSYFSNNGIHSMPLLLKMRIVLGG